MRILSAIIAVFIFTAGALFAENAEDILGKAQSLYEQGKWKEAKAKYEILLKNYKNDPAISAKAVGIRDRIMRCDFYNDDFNFDKVIKDEYGIKKFNLKEGKRPMVDIEFDFDNENEAKFFAGSEVQSGGLISKTNFIRCGVKLKDPCVIELYPRQLPSVGFQINLFASENNEGDREGYVLTCIHQDISKYQKITQIVLYYYTEGGQNKLLKQYQRQGVGLGDVKKIVISKNRGNLSFQIGNISIKEKHPDLEEGYFTMAVDGGSKVMLEKVKLKGATDSNWISTIKGEIEGGRWMKFKKDYAEKYGGVAAEEGDEGEDGKKENRSLTAMVLLDSSETGVSGKDANKIMNIIVKAINFINQRKTKEAETELDRGIQQYPKEYILPFFKGVARLWAGSFDGALESLGEAEKLKNNEPRIYFAKGQAYLGKKEYDNAINSFIKSTEVNPEFYAGYVYECLSIYYSGDIHKAENKMRSYAAKYPDNEYLEMGNKMLYLLKNGPQWASKYTEEGKHYIVHSETSQEQAKKLLMHVEAVHNYYTKFFPSVKKEIKYQVYQFESFASFADYAIESGELPPHPGIGGLFHPVLKHLLIRGDREENEMLGTLYHEGLHQYLDYFLDDVPIWFNEGLATFFEASYFTQRGLKVGVLNKGRLRGLEAAFAGKVPNASVMDMKDMMLADHKTFQGGFGNQTLVNYSHVWSMMYYFIMNKQMMQNYLKPYFNLLVEGKTREEAYEAVFAGKINEIQSSWREYYTKKKYDK